MGSNELNYILKQIKRLIIKGNYQFTLKAETELESDGLVTKKFILKKFGKNDNNFSKRFAS